MFSLEKHLFRSSAHFLIMLAFFFLMLSCTSSLYISDINPKSDVLIVSIFSHLVSGLFCIVSFAVQKLLSLMLSHLFNFAFVSLA